MTRVKRNPVNVSYNKNVNDYSLQISRWCLKPIGAWPLTDNTLERTIAFIHIAACSITIAIVTVPCILYILLEDDSLKKKLGSFAPLTHRIMGSISYWILLTHSEDIRDCIRHMEMDWKLVRRAEDHEVMLQYAKFGRFIAAISAIVMHGGQFLFSVARAIRTVEIIVDNQTFTTYPMTCPAYGRIIDTRFSPTKEIMLVTQFISAFIVGSAIVSVCSLAAVFAMHACGQLNVMYAWLNDFVEKYEKDDHLIDKKLTVIVEHHLRVLSFIARVENTMHKVCFVLLVGCTLIMCFIGYYSIMNGVAFDAVKIVSYIITYTSVSFNIFIFCYIGEILTDQCRNVGEMVYMTNWYQLPRKTTLCLILIIMRSSKVIKITAGKLIHLSVGTFGDVIKTSMAYLNILRTMTM